MTPQAGQKINVKYRKQRMPWVFHLIECVFTSLLALLIEYSCRKKRYEVTLVEAIEIWKLRKSLPPTATFRGFLVAQNTKPTSNWFKQ